MPTRTILDETWVHGTKKSHVTLEKDGELVSEERWEILLLDRATQNTIVYTMNRARRDDLLKSLSGGITLADEIT